MTILNKKGIKTTIVAVVVLLLGICSVVALILDKIDKDEFTVIMSSIGVLGMTVIGYLAKDQDKTHTTDPIVTADSGGELPPDDDEEG